MLLHVFQFVGYIMLNLDVKTLTNSIGCIHCVQPTNLGNIHIMKLLRLQIYEEVGWHAFYWKAIDG